MNKEIRIGDVISINSQIKKNNFEVEDIRKEKFKKYYLINFDGQYMWLPKERIKKVC
jgi:hypothetical protein